MRCLGTSPTFGEIERHLQVHKIGEVQRSDQIVVWEVCRNWESFSLLSFFYLGVNSCIISQHDAWLTVVISAISCLEKTGDLDFSTFLTMMHRQMQQEDPKTEILEALRMTDKQKKGYIQASELRAKLTKLGEKLTDKEGNRNVQPQAENLSCTNCFFKVSTQIFSVVQLQYSLYIFCSVTLDFKWDWEWRAVF